MMTERRWAIFVLLLAAVALVVAVPTLMVTRESRMEVTPPDPARTVYLSALPWEWATTGWVALADDNLPKLDLSFLNGVITLGEKTYDKGLGVYPLSEMVYSLEGKYSRFQAEVGLDGGASPLGGSVVFKVFLDDALAFDSGVVYSGVPPVLIDLPVAGFQKMKLVVEDAGDGPTLDYANWANATLTTAGRSPGLATGLSAGQLARALEANRDGRRQAQQRDREDLRQRMESRLVELDRTLGRWPPDFRVNAVFDPQRSEIVLANDRVALTLGYGGDRNGLLDVVDLETQALVAYDTTPSLATRDSGAVTLARDTTPAAEDGYRFVRVEDPVLGNGIEVSADYLVPDSGVIITPRISLFDEQSYLTYQLEWRDENSEESVRSFFFFDPQAGGGFVLGEEAEYLTDYSMVRRAEVRDDAIPRREPVGLGKPVLVFDRAGSRGMLMAILDEVEDPARFYVRMDSGRVSAQLGFEHSVPRDERDSHLLTSPRLFFQPVPAAGLRQATEQYRGVVAGLYPPPPIPDWVKYQWGTWYAFRMQYDEETLRDHVDYISRNLADLGPWSILLDAGWYVAEGRPGSTWEVDREKFPSGLRALVDYAHSKGIKVVLYFSAPYLDDREAEGNWLALRGFIEEHPDWVIRLQADSEGASYVYDFTNPELQAYMRRLISDFFTVYDVDGIKIDGLGQAEGELLTAEERDAFGDVNKIRMFTMPIYRLVYEEATRAKKDVYIESGWAIPNFANQFAHTFRYGDEFPEFQNRYPHPGLLEHLDYATLQKRVTGQRPNMGMVWGGAESQRAIRSWFEAALALGTQMTVSTDLAQLSNQDLSALRSVLVHYNAFQGETHFVGMPYADSFATTTNGITYLGALNRGQDPKSFAFKLSDYGLEEEREYLVYDVSAGRYSRVRGSLTANLSGSSFRIFLLRDTPGVVWTNASFQTDSSPGSLKVEVAGPRSIVGFAQLYTPRPERVLLDGKELQRNSRLEVGSNYWWDQDTGVLRLRFRFGRPHTIEVEY